MQVENDIEDCKARIRKKEYASFRSFFVLSLSRKAILRFREGRCEHAAKLEAVFNVIGFIVYYKVEHNCFDDWWFLFYDQLT